jgi:hypothetical protein
MVLELVSPIFLPATKKYSNDIAKPTSQYMDSTHSPRKLVVKTPHYLKLDWVLHER